MTWVVIQQEQELSEKTITIFEKKLLDQKKEELRNYISLAKTSIRHIYQNPAKNTLQAQQEAREILNDLDFGPNGYFYVYDYKGNNIVHPKQPERVGSNWWNLKDPSGNLVIRNLIRKAQNGEGFHSYLWEKPSIKKITQKIGYAETLDKWQWMIGTGLYIDDVKKQIEFYKAEVRKSVQQTSIIIVFIACLAVFIVFTTGLILNFSEKRLADAKLKALTKRVIDTQEEERKRVARELHDGISQILVSIKYGLEKTLHYTKKPVFLPKNQKVENIVEKALCQLMFSISEIRRISRDLRPGMLDDLGLTPALESLCAQFNERTGVEVDFKSVRIRNLLPTDAKTALYRVAQEALTNIERHANATKVRFHLSLKQDNVLLTIIDNGTGFVTAHIVKSKQACVGIGLRNMQERIEHFNGTFEISSSRTGTRILARIPTRAITPRVDIPQNIEQLHAAE
ncbi:MAG: cache domain-containing protein [Pseudomonadota bacterium]